MNESGIPEKTLSIWVFTDDKPGHRNQLEGLLGALAKRRTLKCIWLPLDGSLISILTAVKQCCRSPRPDFIIGAGHRTHLPMLLTRLLTGGKTIVLMKPSLPLSCFDFALIPAHDGDFNDANVVTTEGVINKITPSRDHDPTKGLFLIGGPSKHFGWNSADLALQIETVINAQPEITWQLTTSRRTPDTFLTHLNNLNDKIKLIPHTETDVDWLPRQLSEAGQVWVTEDSVSMIYESLTSGADTGLLEIPKRKSGRIQRGIRQLLDKQSLFSYSNWLETQKTSAPSIQLNEAQRCADLILDYFNHAE
ncbi:MAG: mitochondrial fission ELM1 family protein [Gammaproteobacteria bacterium]